MTSVKNSQQKTNEKSGTKLSLTDKNSAANSFLKNTQETMDSIDYLYERAHMMAGK